MQRADAVKSTIGDSINHPRFLVPFDAAALVLASLSAASQPVLSFNDLFPL